MNIFVLDSDPQKIAQFHNDKHVIKMILETAQLLCSAHHVLSPSPHIPYKLAFKNHPCAIWTRYSKANYSFLAQIGLHLCQEYSFRYQKIHKTQSVIEWLKENEPKNDYFAQAKFSMPAMAMPEKYKTQAKSLDDVIKAYRNYYIHEKASFSTWKREVPEWFKA